MDSLAVTRVLSYLVILVSSAVLLGFLAYYVNYLLEKGYRHGWWMLCVGTGAGILYGLSGIVHAFTGQPVVDLFRQGAALFFILFLALGIREVYHLEEAERAEFDFPAWSYWVDYRVWFDYVVIGLFILAWWAPFLLNDPVSILVFQTVGWVGALGLALYYGILTVYRFEGTSIAAVVRHLLPAVLCFGGIVLIELLHLATGRYEALAEAAWIVGIVLVGAFLFNTAIAIRQHRAELHRIHDRTTLDYI